jgi:hypothetical protein
VGAFTQFNALPPEDAERELLTCCASPRWARRRRGNDGATERAVVRGELGKIIELRLERLVTS